MLSDHEIKSAFMQREIDIEPWDYRMVQPASIDLRLNDWVLYAKDDFDVIDPKMNQSKHWSSFKLGPEGSELAPGDFMLACTMERVSLGPMHAARVEGKSSLGRLGLLTHVTAGFIDPGFEGQITLELKNVNRRPIVLYPGMKIAQLCFIKMSKAPRDLYGSAEAGSHYQGQIGPQPSQSWKNFYQYSAGDG